MRSTTVVQTIALGMILSWFAPCESIAQVSGTYFGSDGGWGEVNKWTSNPQFPDNGGVATLDCTGPRNFPRFSVDIGPSVSISKLIVTNSEFQPEVSSPFGNTTLTLVGPAEVQADRVRRGTAFLTYLNAFVLDNVGGANGLTKTGPGVMQLGSSNTFTGDLTVRDGYVEVRQNDAWGPASNRMILDGGGFRAPFTESGPNNFSRNIVLGPSGGTLATTARANFNSVIEGIGALNIRSGYGNNPIALLADNTYTGDTTIRGGTVSLSIGGSTGAIRNSSALRMNGGTVELDNSSAANSDRLNDAGLINITNGTLTIRGNASTAIDEHAGALITDGHARVALRPVGAVPVQLSVQSLTNSGQGAIRFSTLNSSATVSVAQAPTLVGGDGSSGTNRPIIPFAISGESSANYTFLGYGSNGAATALHPLTADEYATSLAGASVDSNVDVTAPETVNEPVIVNALRARTTIGGNGTITITSGALLGPAPIAAPINFGSAQGMVAGNLSLSGPLAGSNGVVFHDGAFTLYNTSTYTGTTALRGADVLLGGDVAAGAPGPFGIDTSPVKIGGGSTVQWAISAPVTISRSLDYDGTAGHFLPMMQQSFLIAPNSPTLTIAGELNTNGLLVLDAAANGRVDITGPVSGTGMLQTADASLTVAITSANNTFSGGILLNRGTFLAGADNALGTGSIQLNDGTLVALGGPRTLANQLVLLDHITFATGSSLTFTGGADLGVGTSDNSGTKLNIPAGGVVTFAGPVIGGTLTINSDAGNTGTLHLTHDNPQLASPISILRGTLDLASRLAVSERGGTISVGSSVATLNLSNDVVVNRYVGLSGGGQPAVGTLSINSTSGSNSIATLSIVTSTNISVGSGTLAAFATVSGTSPQRMLTKTGGGNLVIPPATIASNFRIEDGAVHLLPRSGLLRALNTTTLTLANGFQSPASTLNLENNALRVIDFAVPFNNLVSAIRFARNGGAWDKPGITSFAAQRDPTRSTTLGVLTAPQYFSVYGFSASFGGIAIGGPSLLVKYTYYGDTDFNGVVNFDDYARIDAGFNAGANDWFGGDFDLNGMVNFDDYALIDLAFNVQGGTLTRAISWLDGRDRSDVGMDAEPLHQIRSHYAQFGDAYAQSFLSAVPEPTIGFGTIGFAAGLLQRRRRGRPACSS